MAWLVAGCATATVQAPADIPAGLAVPRGQVPFVEALATGVQIYECDAAPGAASPGTWKFQAPEAVLVDPSGRAIGKHYAGPTWESVDGSRVVGQVSSSVPSPDPRSISWLSVTVRSSVGPGAFASATSVLRMRTSGGVAPDEPCNASNAKQVARVPYKATYYLYRAAL
jgi:hypothetical protein